MVTEEPIFGRAIGDIINRVRGLEERVPTEVLQGSRYLKAAYAKQVLVPDNREHERSDNITIEHLLKFNRVFFFINNCLKY